MRVETIGFVQLSFGLVSALFVSACGGGGGGGDGSSSFTIVEVSNGFGKLLPHTIAVRDAQGLPTAQFVEITRFDQLVANVTANNLIQSTTEWPDVAILPNSLPGNHFIFARFSRALDPLVVLARDSSTEPGSIGAAIQVQTVNPNTGALTPIEGRAFVGGRAFGPAPSNDPDEYLLQTWVTTGGGGIQAATLDGETPGLGFPGTEAGTSFAGDTLLVDSSTFVFVVDSDNDLTTHEKFPVGQIQMRIGTQVTSANGKRLRDGGLASSTVGPDTIRPEVLVDGGTPVILPRDAEVDVDPQTNIVVEFTEPMQVTRVGSLDDGTPPALSASILLSFGPSSAKVTVPFTVRPVSVFDLTRFELDPVYDFPGTGPALGSIACESLFGTVDVVVTAAQLADLSPAGNLNTLSPRTSFVTREGPGLVNAPVTPDAVYIGRTGSVQGISVIDLNGFGGGTGNPTFDVGRPIKKGNTNYPNNPNVALLGPQLIPPLAPGSCTFNGGSAGPLTLVRDSSLRDLVASSPLIESVGDMALGHALDNTFNNESPFGCQSGAGNICAQSGLKNVSIISGGPNTVASANSAPVVPLKTDPGVENLACWAPHPNPPPLVFPPLCLSPLINALEPTSILTTCAPTAIGGCNTTYGPPFNVSGGPTLRNLLVPGPFPFGNPDIGNGLPPQSSLTSEQNCYFEGPATPQTNIQLCQPYMVRQQVGHFLYVVDRVAGEIVVFNSNRFTILDRIRLLDPTSLAMSPNLDFLAVTNEGADLVTFIDIDPSSASFHQVVKTTTVGTGPTGIAWESANEDIFVCNQGEGTVAVISAFTLEVRKLLRNQISRPVDVVLTPRQTVFGFARGVYFGFILNQNGNVAFFESGPDGVNGFGFDDVIGSLPFTFGRPKTLQVDPTNLNSSVWILHEGPLDEQGNATGQRGGAISNVGISGGVIGTIPLDPGPFVNPQIRQLEFSVLSSVGEGPLGLSGIPVDIAFDNMRQLSALTNYSTTFSPGNALSYNGKSLVRILGGAALQATTPQFMFVAVPNPGVVDVYDLSSGIERVDVDVFIDGLQSITAPNASVLMDYFRQ